MSVRTTFYSGIADIQIGQQHLSRLTHAEVRDIVLQCVVFGGKKLRDEVREWLNGGSVMSELRFNRLKKEWIRGTEKLSNLSQIILHPAYQQIIAMGPEAIPFILRSLEKETDHWFWALKMLNEDHDVAEGENTMVRIYLTNQVFFH